MAKPVPNGTSKIIKMNKTPQSEERGVTKILQSEESRILRSEVVAISNDGRRQGGDLK